MPYYPVLPSLRHWTGWWFRYRIACWHAINLGAHLMAWQQGIPPRP